MRRTPRVILALALCGLLHAAQAADHVDITWMSITNLYLDFGRTRIVADGYITRLPQDLFFGGGGGLAQTRRAMRPDEAAVREVFEALCSSPGTATSIIPSTRRSGPACRERQSSVPPPRACRPVQRRYPRVAVGPYPAVNGSSWVLV